jgi:membrane-associated phospholipid phosphatase
MAAWERAILDTRQLPVSSLEEMLDTPRRLWTAAAACVVAFIALLTVVYTTEEGLAADKRALEGFGDLQRPRLAELSDGVAHLCDPLPFALISVALVALALFRRGPVGALAAGTILVGANVTTQILKPLLANPRGTYGSYGVATEAFPSGHATAAMSLALVAIVIASPRIRPLVAIAGAGFALAVGFAIVSLDWHFPSDVAGGYLVAATWCFATLAAVHSLDRERVRATGSEEPIAWWLAAGAMLVPLVVIGVLAIDRLPRITGYAEGHTTFAVVAAATTALVAVLVAAVLAVPTRR